MHNKRFIAGARCPQCTALDKIFTYSEAGKKWRACAQCSFVESFDEGIVGRQRVSPEELPTRVNQQRVGEATLAHETPAEAVVLVDMDKSGVVRGEPKG